MLPSLLNPPFGTTGVGVGLLNRNAEASSNTKKLVIFFGQSPALGLLTPANVTNYPSADLSQPYSAVQWVDHNALGGDPPSYRDEGPKDLAPRTQGYGSYNAGMGGIELVLLRELDQAYPTVDWYGAKMAIDGSGLENQWDNASFPTGGPAILTQLINFIQARVDAWGITDLPNNLYVIWRGGQADSGESPDSSNVLTHLDSISTALRNAFGNIHIWGDRVSSSCTSGGAIQEVRGHTEGWRSGHSSVNHVVYLDEIPLRDAAHETDDGFVTAALRYLASMRAVIDNTSVASPFYFGSSTQVVASSVQAVNVVLPDNYIAGEFLLVVLSGIGNNNYALTDPNAFMAQLTGSPQHDGASGLNARLQVWGGILPVSSASMGGPGISALSIADVAGDDAKVVVSLKVKGAKTAATPVNITAGSTAAASTSISFPAVTTTVDQCLILHFLAHHTDIAIAQVSALVNAGLTDLFEHVDLATTTGSGAGLFIAAGVKTSAGSTGNTTATLASAVTQAMLTVALAPP